MRRIPTLVFCGAVFLTACADHPAAPPAVSTPEITLPAQKDAGVASVGILIERRGSTLVLEQRGFEFTPAPGVTVGSARHEPSIGRAGGELQVLVDASTQIYFNGERVSLDGLPLGTPLLAAGTPEGGSLSASLISDLAGMRAPSRAQASARDQRGRTVETRLADATAAAETSLCIGQLMDYFLDELVYEFHGCWGGPSVTHTFDFDPGIRITCSPIGCWVIDSYTYTFALGGWTFDFPFSFNASSPGLTYHVPGPVSLSLAGMPATGPGFTFTGGLGFNLSFDVGFCFFIGGACVDVHTVEISEFSSIHQTTGPGPLRPTERLDIIETACPSVGLIGIPGTPIDVLEIAFCEDLGLNGRPFHTRARFDGTRGTNEASVAFEGANVVRTVTPDALFVEVSHRDFYWAPEMTSAFYFRFELVGQTIYESPRIPLVDGPFEGVTTPFPLAFGFTLATDPQSPELLFQPTATDPVRIPVAPAPTTLAIISPPTLEEGSPLEARLTESFDGSPIAGAQLRFTVTNASGTQQTVGTTDGGGIARLTLPNGEHTVTVNFDGSQFYLPSSAGPQQVFVYQPTTFVIWGGNAGGIALGGRYNFWGSQWHKQVTGGDFTANASFKGYAHTATGTSWIAGGGNSTRPPDHLGGLIGVIVSTVITREGESTMGNIAQRVILRVENPVSYRPNPGHEAFGTVEVEIPAAALARR